MNSYGFIPAGAKECKAQRVKTGGAKTIGKVAAAGARTARPLERLTSRQHGR